MSRQQGRTTGTGSGKSGVGSGSLHGVLLGCDGRPLAVHYREFARDASPNDSGLCGRLATSACMQQDAAWVNVGSKTGVDALNEAGRHWRWHPDHEARLCCRHDHRIWAHYTWLDGLRRSGIQLAGLLLVLVLNWRMFGL